MATVTRILGSLNWCLIFITIAIYVLIFIIVKHRRQRLQDVSILLVCNTCLAALLTCCTTCIMTSSNLFTGFLIRNLNFCYVWGFLYDTFECSIYYSYCLQSFYRLCRVVFYKKRFLLSFSLYMKMVIGQWLFTFFLILPTLFLYYIRLPTEQYCLIPYTDINGSIYLIVVLYFIPLVCIISTYLWITTFIRQSSGTSTTVIIAQQRQRNLRDLTIIKRLVILILILVLLRFPTIIFIIYGVIVGQLFFLTYTVVGLVTSICLIFIGLMTIYTTQSLRKNILIVFNHRNNQVNVQQAP